jgi:putative ABC transport system substrate-binding protein
VVASIAKSGRPICGVCPEFARAGCLMSYSIDREYGFRLTGVQVAKILRGEKPGDLPIEQADKFSLVVNMKAAKMLGIAVPENSFEASASRTIVNSARRTLSSCL